MQRLATQVMNLAQDPEPCLLSTICRSTSTSLRSSATSSSRLQGSAILGMSGPTVAGPEHWLGFMPGSESRSTTRFVNL